MSWTYAIDSGRLYSDAGELVGVGYSGDTEHKNDPVACQLHDQGPIPPGTYTVEAPRDTPDHGPYVLPLTPDPANQMYGRSGFLMHGDAVHAPGTASKGCMIMARGVRWQVWESKDRTLEVVPTVREDYFTGG